MRLHSLPTRLGRKALIIEIPISGQSLPLAIVTSHLESYPQDIIYRRQQMDRIFDILKPYSNAIFTADFNFSKKNEGEYLPKDYIDSWHVCKIHLNT